MMWRSIGRAVFHFTVVAVPFIFAVAADPAFAPASRSGDLITPQAVRTSSHAAPSATSRSPLDGVPTSLAAEGIGATTIEISWSGPATEYRVIRKEGRGETFKGPFDSDAILVYQGLAHSVIAQALEPETAYTFAVYGRVGSSYTASGPTITARTSPESAGTTYYVNAGTGNDSNSGLSSGTSFKTIKKAITVVTSGDTINVASGTYDTMNGETFPITMPSGVKLLGSGALTTFIDAAGANQRVVNCNGNSSSTIITGFTLRNGIATGDFVNPGVGGGIYCSNGDQTTITRNIITNNIARGISGNNMGQPNGGSGMGGGIYVDASYGLITNNVISHNTAVGGGGVMLIGGGTGGTGGTGSGGGFYATVSANIVNNTVVSNSAGGGEGGTSLQGTGGTGGNAYYGGGYADVGSLVRNNIFASNRADGGGGGLGSGFHYGPNGSGFVGGYDGYQPDHCLFFSNLPATGGNNGNNAVFADPSFVNAASDDYHICCVSGAKATGTALAAPVIDFDGFLRPDPPSIGAYENDSAQLSIPGELVATATSSSQVVVSWSRVDAATSYDIFVTTSLSAGFGNTPAASTSNTSFIFSNLTANTSYLYKVRAVNNMTPSSLTPLDAATTVALTDDPIIPGSTTVKVAHITELRTAANALRTAANLAAYTFTDSSLSAGVTIKAAHINDLRTAINEARSALGLPAFTYTDSITAQSTTIRAVHITDLRTAVN